MNASTRRVIAHLRDIDIDGLIRDLTDLDTHNRNHPSTPDGYPTQTPGAAPAPANGRTGGSDIKLTSVEAAADARHRTSDPYMVIHLGALRAIEQAAGHLAHARQLLDQVRHIPADRAKLNPEPGCWAMARIGAWEAVYATTDLASVFGTPLDEKRPLGRWAYDFARSRGRLPTVDECKQRHMGRRVMVDA